MEVLHLAGNDIRDSKVYDKIGKFLQRNKAGLGPAPGEVVDDELSEEEEQAEEEEQIDPEVAAAEEEERRKKKEEEEAAEKARREREAAILEAAKNLSSSVGNLKSKDEDIKTDGRLE